MCSFDGVSLFTNVPFKEVIDICVDAIYHCKCGDIDLQPIGLSEKSFHELMEKVTSGVEFSFDGIMYRQIDGVAMGSPLGPILTNILVVYYESKIPGDKWPDVYNRFVDDVSSHFVNRNACDEFLVLLNRLHTALMFTCEHEEDGSPPCMDVRVRRIDTSVETLVYRKPTFTGLCTTRDSFSPPQYKINAVRSLVNRAQRIFSSSTLDSELDELRKIFRKNGYPEVVLRKYIVSEPHYRIPFIGPLRCPVTIRLPWLGVKPFINILRRKQGMLFGMLITQPGSSQCARHPVFSNSAKTVFTPQ